MFCGWEGNRRSCIRLEIQQGLDGLGEDDGSPPALYDEDYGILHLYLEL